MAIKNNENINESHYDKEYFFDYSHYKELLKSQPEPMLPNYGEHKFEFYQFGFQNGVSVFLFEDKEDSIDFVSYMNFETNCIMCDHIDNSMDRVLKESVKRNTLEFTQLCEQLANDKKYCVIYCPFKLDMQKPLL